MWAQVLVYTKGRPLRLYNGHEHWERSPDDISISREGYPLVFHSAYLVGRLSPGQSLVYMDRSSASGEGHHMYLVDNSGQLTPHPGTTLGSIKVTRVALSHGATLTFHVNQHTTKILYQPKGSARRCIGRSSVRNGFPLPGPKLGWWLGRHVLVDNQQLWLLNKDGAVRVHASISRWSTRHAYDTEPANSVDVAQQQVRLEAAESLVPGVGTAIKAWHARACSPCWQWSRHMGARPTPERPCLVAGCKRCHSRDIRCSTSACDGYDPTCPHNHGPNHSQCMHKLLPVFIDMVRGKAVAIQ